MRSMLAIVSSALAIGCIFGLLVGLWVICDDGWMDGCRGKGVFSEVGVKSKDGRKLCMRRNEVLFQVSSFFHRHVLLLLLLSDVGGYVRLTCLALHFLMVMLPI